MSKETHEKNSNFTAKTHLGEFISNNGTQVITNMSIGSRAKIIKDR